MNSDSNGRTEIPAMQRLGDLRKSVLFTGVILLFVGIAFNMFLFLVSLPGGPGTQQPFDWVIVLTSTAPAYLPWKIPLILYALAVIIIISGWLPNPKNID